MAEQSIQITYWKGLRGRADLVLAVASLVGAKVDYVEVLPEDLPKAYEGAAFPNLPLLTYGGEKISETAGIVSFLAEIYRPEVAGKTVLDRAIVQQICGVAMDAAFSIIKSAYIEEYEAKVPESLKGIVAKKLSYIEAHLKGKKFAVGDSVTIADVYLQVLLRTKK